MNKNEIENRITKLLILLSADENKKRELIGQLLFEFSKEDLVDFLILKNLNDEPQTIRSCLAKNPFQ